MINTQTRSSHVDWHVIWTRQFECLNVILQYLIWPQKENQNTKVLVTLLTSNWHNILMSMTRPWRNHETKPKDNDSMNTFVPFYRYAYLQMYISPAKMLCFVIFVSDTYLTHFSLKGQRSRSLETKKSKNRFSCTCLSKVDRSMSNQD